VEGHGTKTAYVVLEGSVEVRLHGERLAQFGTGEIFGEFAFLLHTKRTADVIAATDRVRLLLLDDRTLQRLLASQPALAAKFLLNLSKTLALRLLNRSR
jgi:CRP-like cAMP-binding protein